MLIARIDPITGKEQALGEHCQNVARLTAALLAPLGLEAMGRLIGMIHDAGKANTLWKKLLKASCGQTGTPVQKVPHAQTGAIYAYNRWYQGGFHEKLTAQLIAMAIRSHHSGFPDCYDVNTGESPFLDSMEAAMHDERLHFDETMRCFLSEVADEEALDALFAQAVAEMRGWIERLTQIDSKDDRLFDLGMVARLLLSALVDADRLDSARFAYGDDPDDGPAAGVLPVPWEMLHARLESTLAALERESGTDGIHGIRADISQRCLDAAVLPKGIYRLTVPTGGGKTLSSLRFALRHAGTHGAARLFYVVPFNTILDQTADAIRRSLAGYERILEHHGNVVLDSEEEYTAHARLTQRWDGDIVLTSLVQFMDSLFRRENTNARRMHSLQNAIIVFDEVQAIPQNCIGLFERAVRFLTDLCGCTVVLCTATQPVFELACREIIQDAAPLFDALRRTRIIDETDRIRRADEAGRDALVLLDMYGSLLMVVNTKKMAAEIYRLVRDAVPAVHVFHLSTDMYPAHRREKLREMRALLRDGERVFCVSTTLIEAGIDVSFPCVIRSFAGLPSILQAGGRCNRNCELPDGTFGAVYVWRLDEQIKTLSHIVNGQNLSREVFEYAAKNRLDLQQVQCVEGYFKLERDKYSAQRRYPLPNTNTDMVSALGANAKGKRAAENLYPKYAGKTMMTQAFRTAGEAFHVIDEQTVTVVAEHGEGKELLRALNGAHTLKDKRSALRKLQQYSVNLYQGQFLRLHALQGILSDENNGIYILREVFYDDDTGVTEEPRPMELLNC